VPSIERRVRDGELRWDAGFRDPAGAQQVKVFNRRVDAERFLTTVEGSKLTGSYTDAKPAAITFGAFAALAAAPEHHRALVITLVGAGLRISEACGRQVEDIDFGRHRLCVRQQRRPSGEFGHLKTGCARRDIPADDAVLGALAEQIRR
jgi:integrase